MNFPKIVKILVATAFIGSLAFTGSLASAQDEPIQAEPPLAQVAPEAALAPVAPKFASETFEAMMGAIEDNNRAAFAAYADANFKAALTPPIFEQVSARIAPRLKNGHAFTYLGEMNQAGFVVYLWRVRFDDGGDDALAQMSVKDKKVGGFFLR